MENTKSTKNTFQRATTIISPPASEVALEQDLDDLVHSGEISNEMDTQLADPDDLVHGAPSIPETALVDLENLPHRDEKHPL